MGAGKTFLRATARAACPCVGPLGLLFFCVPGGLPLVLYASLLLYPLPPFPLSPFFPTSPFFSLFLSCFSLLPPPYLSVVSAAGVCFSLVDSGGWFPSLPR